MRQLVGIAIVAAPESTFPLLVLVLVATPMLVRAKNAVIATRESTFPLLAAVRLVVPLIAHAHLAATANMANIGQVNAPARRRPTIKHVRCGPIVHLKESTSKRQGLARPMRCARRSLRRRRSLLRQICITIMPSGSSSLPVQKSWCTRQETIWSVVTTGAVSVHRVVVFATQTFGSWMQTSLETRM